MVEGDPMDPLDAHEEDDPLNTRFGRSARDTVSLIKKTGEQIEGIRAYVQPDKIFIYDGSVPVEEGDTISRPMSNGLTERYTVLDRGFYETGRHVPAHYQAKVRKETAIQNDQPPRTSNTFHVSGPNSRVNIGSVDASVNIAQSAPDVLFEELRETIRSGITVEEEKTALLANVDAMETATQTGGLMEKYNAFIQCAANHMTLIAPFIPPLTQLLTSHH
jgi:hypothetical protein